jgi:hypothetical protein
MGRPGDKRPWALGGADDDAADDVDQVAVLDLEPHPHRPAVIAAVGGPPSVAEVGAQPGLRRNEFRSRL